MVAGASVAEVLVVGVRVAGCSGASASVLAKPPTFDPKDQSKCGVVKSQAQPLIVEWPDAERGKLEAQVKRGVVAVRYVGCDMQLLGRCSVPGNYGYAPYPAGRRFMIVYSLIATCERHDVNPEVYLADVLIRIQDHPKDRVAELLPHRWKATFGSGFAVARVETSGDEV